ncbi:MAG: phosphoribosylglycinamide formyltransferase [Gammaproteobacteria bacterium]
MHDPANAPLPVVILISGRGSNLQAIINCVQAGRLPIEIRAVISNRPQAGGLQLAAAAGITAEVVDHTHYPDRDAFDHALQQRIDRHAPRLVVLAGFMRILTPAFVEHYRGHMLNIHPSLLPAFPGLNTHRRALDTGVSEHGASVHFVTADTDCGPVIAQARVPIKPGDTEDSLAARVLEQEHRLYPLAILWYALGRIREDGGGGALLDGIPLYTPVDMASVDELPC